MKFFFVSYQFATNKGAGSGTAVLHMSNYPSRIELTKFIEESIDNESKVNGVTFTNITEWSREQYFAWCPNPPELKYDTPGEFINEERSSSLYQSWDGVFCIICENFYIELNIEEGESIVFKNGLVQVDWKDIYSIKLPGSKLNSLEFSVNIDNDKFCIYAKDEEELKTFLGKFNNNENFKYYKV